MIFSWSLCCQCPCPPSETHPTSTSLGGPPIFLGRSLDPPRALWGNSDSDLVHLLLCTCPQSPQLPKLDWSQLWEYLLSIQILHRPRIYKTACVAAQRDFCSSSLVTQLLRLSFGLGPTSRYGPHSGVCSPPRWEGTKAVADWGSQADWGTYSHRLGRNKAATTRVCTKTLRWQEMTGR